MGTKVCSILSNSGPWPSAIILSDIGVWIIPGQMSFTRMPRVSIPRTATQMVILPKLARFNRTNPEIILEITSSNDPVDLVAGEYDAGVQLGEFIQRDMIAVRVTKEMRLAVVGAPGYFESNPIPRSPPATPSALISAPRLSE